MSAFCTMRRASLPSIFVAVKPGVPPATTNPFTLSSATSRAQTTMWSAKVALPIQRLAPLRTHSSPSRFAVVRRPRATSEPPVGSVRANAPIFSRRNISGSQRSRCSSEPHWTMLPIARPEWTPKNVANDASTRASSIETNELSRRLAAGALGPLVAETDDVERRELRDQLVRELAARPVVRDDGRDLPLGEVADAADERAVVVGEQVLVAVEVAAEQRQRVLLGVRHRPSPRSVIEGMMARRPSTACSG
jgi:hypothetical protein